MTEPVVPRRVFVDWNRVGNAARFELSLSVDEAAGLAVGELIILAGDDDTPRPARVIRRDRLDATVQLLVPHTGRSTDLARQVAEFLRPCVSDLGLAIWWASPQPELGWDSPAAWLEGGGDATALLAAARHTAAVLGH